MPMSLKLLAFDAIGKNSFAEWPQDASNCLIFKGFEDARKKGGGCFGAAWRGVEAVLEAPIATWSRQERRQRVLTPGGASGGLWRREILAQAL